MAANLIEARIHATLLGSRANGPGGRNGVGFQGCRRKGPGCSNPETHPLDGGETVAVPRLADQILSGSPQGVTISGGEPLEQPGPLLALLQTLRRQAPKLSLLLFTGYTLDQIRTLPNDQRIHGYLDILVAGPYVQSLHLGKGLIASHNQSLHLLTSRNRMGELEALPATEVILCKDGTIIVTGQRSLSGGIGT